MSKLSIMVFQIGEQLFGYQTKFISETVNIEKIFSVPKAKSYLKGLFNLRNSVVGIIDMGELLWETPAQSDVVVVVSKNNAQVGMLINDVKGVTNVDVDDIKLIDEISIEDINKDYLESFFEYKDEIVLMINIDNILSQKSLKNTNKQLKNTDSSNSSKMDISGGQRGYIFFQMVNEWYAMEVKSINEVITYPEILSSLPKSSNYVKGAFLLRGDSVILVDLPEILKLDDKADRNRVILVNSNGKLIGLSIDTVRELKWVPQSSVMNIDSSDGVQKGIISLENGKRLALLLDIDKILASTNAKIDNEQHRGKEELTNNMDSNKKLKTFVQFEVGDISMALPIHSVNEVVEASQIKAIPKSATYIEGMMNLRNSTLVIISLAKRLEIDANKKNIERVVVLDGKPVGFVVDELSGILRIEEENIFSNEDSLDVEEKYLDGIIKKSDGSIVFILNIDLIIKSQELEKLTSNAK